MKIRVLTNAEELGREAAKYSAEVLRQAIAEKGGARLLLSTGSSQFETLKALMAADVEWDKVEMFHLDEYVNLPESHPASFRRYLRERVISQINLKAAYLVNGEGDIEEHVRQLTEEIRKEPIDLALIGIGENAHIAFNDPPADFETKEAYIVVNLDQKCKEQQIGEGWFASFDDVPNQAISMTVHQIMESRVIVSAVPHRVKADAIKRTLTSEITNLVPATKLKEHANVTLFLDRESASLVGEEELRNFS